MQSPTSKATTDQPQAAIGMKVMNAAETTQNQQCKHEHNQKAWRGRGGGAAKDCFLGALACFVCFECCEGCCSCIGDVVCCPCEMCC